MNLSSPNGFVGDPFSFLDLLQGTMTRLCLNYQQKVIPDFELLLLHRLFHGHRHSDGCANHGIIAHADQAHHFHVGGNGG